MILNISCEELLPFFRVLHYILNFVKIIIPIVLIVLITFDIIKIIKEGREVSEIKNKIIKRVLYALAIFLVPTIVSIIFKQIGARVSTGDLTSPKEWISCYSKTISSSSAIGIVEPTSVSCDQVSIGIKVGQSASLNCFVSPNNATSKNLTYKANNNNVLVSGNNVLAQKVGTSTITVSSVNGKKTIVNIIVSNNEVLPTSFFVSNKEVNLQVGETETINYSFNSVNVTERNIKYSGYDKNIISIENNVIKALKEGKTIITATTKNNLRETITVIVKNINVCEDDLVKPIVSITGDYVYTSLDESDPYSSESIKVTITASDNCSLKSIGYCLKETIESSSCTEYMEISNNDTIIISDVGVKKLIIRAIDDYDNRTIKTYYTKIQEESESNDKKNEEVSNKPSDDDKNDEIVSNKPSDDHNNAEDKEYTCYLGYRCDKGYYYVNYDEYVGSCYEDTKFLFFNTGRKQVGTPYPKFYDSLASLNNAVSSRGTGLVMGWDDAKNAFRFIYKCDVSCGAATKNNCYGYAYYNPTTGETINDALVVSQWNYFDYLESRKK